MEAAVKQTTKSEDKHMNRDKHVGAEVDKAGTQVVAGPRTAWRRCGWQGWFRKLAVQGIVAGRIRGEPASDDQ